MKRIRSYHLQIYLFIFSIIFVFSTETEPLSGNNYSFDIDNGHNLNYGSEISASENLHWKNYIENKIVNTEINLLQNGSFEEGSNTPNSWTNTAWNMSNSIFSWDSTIAFEGEKCIKIYNFESNDASWNQIVTVKPFTKYYLQGWVKTENVETLVDVGANLSIYGTWVYEDLHGTNDWTKIGFEYETENETQLIVAVRLGHWGSIVRGTAWFDDISLTEFTSDSIIDLKFELDSLELFEGWEWKHNKLIATTINQAEYTVSAEDASWTSSDTTIATVDDNGIVTAISDGSANITAQVNSYQATVGLKILNVLLPPVIEVTDSYLQVPAANYKKKIPVVIIRYLPTTDGIKLDTKYAPGYWALNESNLTDVISEIDQKDKNTKFMLEERSKFRGYKNSTTIPYLGYSVIKYITVYEQVPPGEVLIYSKGYPIFWPDYHQIFERFNMEKMVNDLGVKEIWLWLSPMDPSYPSYDQRIHRQENFRSAPESNMSSPLTGDVSNSYVTETDLPVYNHSYTVFDRNTMRRGEADALAMEVHCHQVEQLLIYANRKQDGNDNLFWRNFVGTDMNGNFATGRCGWSHMPPNTTVHYDWDNPNLVWSDIEDWNPFKTGDTSLVNVDTWKNLDYNWPNGRPNDYISIRSQWFVYWNQNMPGYGNSIEYFNNRMTNWWDFTADWDSAISTDLGLYMNASVNIPNDPTNLTLSNITHHSINLSWEDNSNTETNYNIERKIGTGGTWREITQVDADFETYTDINLNPNTEYCYRVRAYNSYSNTYSIKYTNIECAITEVNIPIIIHVPAGQPTIQAGIDFANVGDTVLVADGIYFENINFRGKAITVSSNYILDQDTSHISKTIIDGSQPNNPDSGSVIYFINGEDSNTVLCGFTITGGTGTIQHIPLYNITIRSGGGILCSNSGAYIKNNLIIGNKCIVNLLNQRTAGGGIAVEPPRYNSYVIIRDNTIIKNGVWSKGNSTSWDKAWAEGAGIAVYTDGEIVNNIIKSNNCLSEHGYSVGGGIRLSGGTVTIVKNTINNNSSISNGSIGFAGGVSCSGSNTIIDSNLIIENYIAGNLNCYGAGIYFDLVNDSFWAVVKNNIITLNYGNGGICNGGAIGMYTSSPEIYNNIITKNSANNGGALHAFNNSKAIIMNNTIVENIATSNGGALYTENLSTNLKILNSIFWNNSVKGTVNDIFNNSESKVYVANCIVNGEFSGENNFEIDPMFMDSSFMLSENSICVGNGTANIEINGIPYSCPNSDFYGNIRPNQIDEYVDMGAIESGYKRVDPTNAAITDLLPTEYSLEQNYPNPFNPTTTIKYSIPKQSRVTLKFFDVLGSDLVTLVNKEQSQGNYEIEFDGSELTSGIYFYRLRAEDFVETRKMILLK